MKYKLRLLFIGFVVSFLLVGALSVLSFVQTGNFTRRVEKVEHTYAVVNTINQLTYELLAIDKASFRFISIRDSSFYHDFAESATRLVGLTEVLKQMVADNPSQQNNVVILRSDEAVYLNDCRQLFLRSPIPPATLIHSTDYAENIKKMREGMQRLSQMAAIENELLEKRTAERQNYLQVTTSMMRTLSIIFSLLTLLLFVLLLYQFRKRIRYQDELQQKITEIAQSKRELEHIAYATSHDLQEPLRKIRILTDRWQSQYGDALNKESKNVLDRVISAAARMQDLVGELMMLSSLNADARKTPCQLRQYVNAVSEQMEGVIRAMNATLEIGILPTVQGYPDQIKMLLRNLIDNALKFSKPGIPPHVSITARKAGSEELSPEQRSEQQYHCIIIEDNGIGFDNRYVEKMFGIFRQLHTGREGYMGKGTGLAICQRIMNNHGGHIVAHGFLGEGAVFKLYFPIVS